MKQKIELSNQETDNSTRPTLGAMLKNLKTAISA